MRSKLILKLAALSGMMLAVFVLLALAPGVRTGVARATPPAPVSLLSCPNMDASSTGKVTSADILAVVKHYGKMYGQSGYSLLYDPVAPFNPASPTGTGKVTSSDISYVVHKYGAFCPLVDTQIAEATLAISDPMYSDKLCDPDPSLLVVTNCGGSAQFLTEDADFLKTKGYYRGSSDVPGQGIHYVNQSYWDGVFNPARPEGLVYQGGKLAAQLYVVDGAVKGWGAHEATSCCPGADHGVGLEVAADGPQCSPACSWDGTYDGWHVHHYLCTAHIGTGSAIAIPGALAPSIADTDGHCQSFSGENQCTVPWTAACYTWSANVGWMGHLWNWLPNGNLIPDNGGSNGRFADCYPQATGSPPPNDFWGPFNCPA